MILYSNIKKKKRFIYRINRMKVSRVIRFIYKLIRNNKILGINTDL